MNFILSTPSKMKFTVILLLTILLSSTIVYRNHAKSIVEPIKAIQDTIPYDSLRIALEAMYDTDQGVRETAGSGNVEDLGKLFFQMRQIDSVNQVQVTHILEQYGWLPQSKIGEKAADAMDTK